jgi:hypothetical protein
LVDTDFTKPYQEILKRSKHWRTPTPKDVFTAKWIDPEDDRLVIQKFAETSPTGSLDEVWRASTCDWVVHFLACDRRYNSYETNQYITNESRPQFSHPSYIHIATLFSVTGDIDSLISDAMCWKLQKTDSVLT